MSTIEHLGLFFQTGEVAVYVPFLFLQPFKLLFHFFVLGRIPNRGCLVQSRWASDSFTVAITLLLGCGDYLSSSLGRIFVPRHMVLPLFHKQSNSLKNILGETTSDQWPFSIVLSSTDTYRDIVYSTLLNTQLGRRSIQIK